jgi:hypothetical protein
LLLIGLRIVDNLLSRQRRSSHVLAGRITDHSGEVANQEHHVMTKVLEMPQLVDQYGVPEMQIGCGRIKAGLDPQWPASPQLRKQVSLDQQLFRPPLDQLELLFHSAHATLFCLECFWWGNFFARLRRSSASSLWITSSAGFYRILIRPSTACSSTVGQRLRSVASRFSVWSLHLPSHPSSSHFKFHGSGW